MHRGRQARTLCTQAGAQAAAHTGRGTSSTAGAGRRTGRRAGRQGHPPDECEQVVSQHLKYHAHVVAVGPRVLKPVNHAAAVVGVLCRVGQGQREAG